MPKPEEFLPLKPAVLLLLVSLLNGERHGYALKKDILDRSGGRVRLGPASLYRFLAELLDEGLIRESTQRGEDPRRRSYHLTDLGRRVTRAELQRLDVLIASARRTRVLRDVEP